MQRTIRVFVSYSHKDAEFLDDDSLLGYLHGLQKEGIEFWTDRQITAGEIWDESIRKNLVESDMVLALISQWFLDSPYCIDVESREMLERAAVVVPILLSPCEWRRQQWLCTRQFLPGGDRTLRTHYRRRGDREGMFREIREHIRKQAARLRQEQAQKCVTPNPFGQTLAIRQQEQFIGRTAELRRLLAMLKGGSVALKGEPKIGKSSLLWQLARSSQADVIGPLDFQGIEDLSDFYRELATHLRTADSGWRSLRSSLSDRHALLLLDELDAAPGRGFNGTALARLRSVADINRNLRIVVSSRKNLRDLFPDEGFGSPAYNFLQPQKLGSMTLAEARELLAHAWAPGALRFQEAQICELLELAGGHPFKLQRAAFHLYEALIYPPYLWRDEWQHDMETML